MMEFPIMAEVLKPAKVGRFEIQVFEMTEDEVKFAKLRDAIHGGYRETWGLKPGYYVKLLDGDRSVMSDTWMERSTNYLAYHEAHGNVLVMGLGIGMVLLAMQDKPEVQTITVVEKYQEVIDLVASQLPLNEKIQIVCADAYEWQPTQKFDVVWIDIEPDICADAYPLLRKLAGKYKRWHTNRENPNRWVSFWREDDLAEAYREDRAYYA